MYYNSISLKERLNDTKGSTKNDLRICKDLKTYSEH